MQLTYAEAGQILTTTAEDELGFDEVVTIPVFGLMAGSAISLTLWAALVWAVWVVVS